MPVSMCSPTLLSYCGIESVDETVRENVLFLRQEVKQSMSFQSWSAAVYECRESRHLWRSRRSDQMFLLLVEDHAMKV